MFSDFLLKAQSTHGNRYSYHLVDYVNMVTKVKIECPDHGKFVQYPFHHIKGAGCKACGIARRAEKQKIPIAVRVDRKEKHIQKVAEDKLMRKAVLAQAFIEKSNQIHKGRYNYSEVLYETLQKPVAIICPDHGVFHQRPANHYRGQGCPRCVGHVSRLETEWLDSLGITHRQVCHFVNGRKFVFDGYSPETNTVYLFHGDYWHGNPVKYEATKKHPLLNRTFGDLFSKTKADEQWLIDNHYHVISIWENDFTKKV